MRSVRTKFGFAMVSPLIDVCLAVVIITMATGAMQFFQRESKAKDDLSPESLLQSEQRIATLQARYRDLLQELKGLPSPDQLPKVDLEALEAARQRLLKELAALRREVARTQATLQQTQQQDGQADHQRQRLLDELAGLRRQIEDLETRLKKLRYDREQIEKLKKKLEELARRLQEKQKRFVDLQEEIAAEKAKKAQPAVVVKVHPRFVAPDDLEPEFVVITQGTVTPICPPYYEPAYQDLFGGRLQIGYDFVRPGSAASAALRQGSDFLQWLDKLDRTKHFVFVLLDQASFETFRAVRAEVRRRNIGCGWEPVDGGNKGIRFQGGNIRPGME